MLDIILQKEVGTDQPPNAITNAARVEFSHGGSAEKAEIGHYRLLSCASDPRLFAEIHG